MTHTFRLQVVTVTESLFDGEAQSLELRGMDGDLTVLANHEPFMTRIEPCTIKVVTNDGTHEFPVANGVLEVASNRAVVLCS